MQFRNEQYPNEKNIFYTYVFAKACAHDESEHLPLRTRTFSPDLLRAMIADLDFNGSTCYDLLKYCMVPNNDLYLVLISRPFKLVT